MSEMMKKSWNLAWLLAGGIAFVATAFFLADISRITIHHILYQADFRHWPLNLGITLWLLFAWFLLDAAASPKALQRFHLGIRITKWLALIGIMFFLITTFFGCDFEFT